MHKSQLQKDLLSWLDHSIQRNLLLFNDKKNTRRSKKGRTKKKREAEMKNIQKMMIMIMVMVMMMMSMSMLMGMEYVQARRFLGGHTNAHLMDGH